MKGKEAHLLYKVIINCILSKVESLIVLLPTMETISTTSQAIMSSSATISTLAQTVGTITQTAGTITQSTDFTIVRATPTSAETAAIIEPITASLVTTSVLLLISILINVILATICLIMCKKRKSIARSVHYYVYISNVIISFQCSKQNLNNNDIVLQNSPAYHSFLKSQ